MEPQPQGISYQERERDSVQPYQIKHDFRVAKKAKTPILLNVLKCGGGEGGGADTCKAQVAQLMINKYS